ncbi:MAG: tripartite tricarboxylate transporter substrate binding protein [Betaproteobacteria bacterium]|nr:tripartite tricarboxylate transporter substrate binding protein [Betaproteobacteria bacterium]
MRTASIPPVCIRLTLIVLAAGPVTQVSAQSWQPQRPVRWMVPYVPGGATDLVTRTVAEPLGAALGQQFVVDNRPGATGTIAYDLVARANPDGHTITTAPDALTVLPFSYKKLPFDPRTSFAPITNMTRQPMAIAVNAAIPVRTMKELIDYAKSKAGAVSYATSGLGTSQHLFSEMLKQATGMDITHIPYKGAGQAIIDLAGGQLQLAMVGASSILPQAKAGRARVIAVTSGKRWWTLPEVPTLIESGLVGYEFYHWIGVFGPAKLPRDIVSRLNGEIGRVLASPPIRERLTAAGLEIAPSTPEQLAADVREGMQRWGKVIADAKLEFK